MQQCRALVCLFSKPYFSSLYCGKVWRAFRQRLEAAAGAGPLPPLIFPVLWKGALDLPLIRPRAVEDLQLPDLTAAPPYNEGGVRALLQQAMAGRDNSRQVYDEFVGTLASQV